MEYSQVTEEFLQDDNLLKRLIALLPELKSYTSDNDTYCNAIKFLVATVRKRIFTPKDISTLQGLPDDFDFSHVLQRQLNPLTTHQKSTKQMLDIGFPHILPY